MMEKQSFVISQLPTSALISWVPRIPLLLVGSDPLQSSSLTQRHYDVGNMWQFKFDFN
jgi:hypothetical protein